MSIVAFVAVWLTAGPAIPDGGLLVEPAPRGAPVVVLRWRIEAQNTGATPLDGAPVTVAVPLADAGGQRLVRLDLAGGEGASFVRGVDGAAIVYSTGHLEPGATVVTTITAEVALGAAKARAETGAAWLGAIAGAQDDTGAAALLAAGLSRVAGDDRVRALYDALAARLTPDGFRAARRRVGTTLSVGRGDCTDLALVAVATARAAGLPARLATGWRVTGSALIDPDDYHDWAEVYDGARWRVLDLHAQTLDAAAPQRVVLRYEGRTEEPLPALRGLIRYRSDERSLTLRMLAGRQP